MAQEFKAIIAGNGYQRLYLLEEALAVDILRIERREQGQVLKK